MGRGLGGGAGGVSYLVLAVENEAAKLVADLKDLRVLHLLEEDGQALNRLGLHVVRLIIETFQDSGADAEGRGGGRGEERRERGGGRKLEEVVRRALSTKYFKSM